MVAIISLWFLFLFSEAAGVKRMLFICSIWGWTYASEKLGGGVVCVFVCTRTHVCVNVCVTWFAWVEVKDVWMIRGLFLIVLLPVDMRQREREGERRTRVPVWHRSSVLMWRGVTQHGATADECLNCASALLDGHKQCVEFERGARWVALVCQNSAAVQGSVGQAIV